MVKEEPVVLWEPRPKRNHHAAWESAQRFRGTSRTECDCAGPLAEDNHGRVWCLRCEEEPE